MLDQAQTLRKLVEQEHDDTRQTRIVTVTSGKGGVGKSNFTLNFALALRRNGLKTLIFDADIGMANIDVLMGRSAAYSVYHLLKREKTVWEIISEGPEDVHFIAGGSGFRDLLDLPQTELDYFEAQIVKLQGHYDIILFDTGAGLSRETVSFIAAAQETIVVTTPEPTSITDAYALIKMVGSMQQDAAFKLVVNRTTDEREGRQTADRISLVARQFLELDIPLLGTIPDDANVMRAVKKQSPFSIAFPASGASKAVAEIARGFLNNGTANAPNTGGIRGFIQRMLKRRG
ncbi:MinD/ParA family protein [Paenibacillus sp. IB182496]|uniref:MinD/ParA family protein n=1 Tax=Paenibacillus sabuli TaxID=2772509 RepID=A0A927BTJ5_9BACL|nr:MinD/ParA family protein [Paenibacillus sabuli]MBD2845269.1 MinD/ParA family protein [Paenibacillus sabuli]